jgi:hypothetical protein
MARELNLDDLVAETVTVKLGGRKYRVRGEISVDEIADYLHAMRELKSEDEERMQAGFAIMRDLATDLLGEFLPEGEPPPAVSVSQFVVLFGTLMQGSPEDAIAEALNGGETPEVNEDAAPLAPNRSTRRSAQRSQTGSSTSARSTAGRRATGGDGAAVDSASASSRPTSRGRSGEPVAAT